MSGASVLIWDRHPSDRGHFPQFRTGLQEAALACGHRPQFLAVPSGGTARARRLGQVRQFKASVSSRSSFAIELSADYRPYEHLAMGCWVGKSSSRSVHIVHRIPSPRRMSRVSNLALRRIAQSCVLVVHTGVAAEWVRDLGGSALQLPVPVQALPTRPRESAVEALPRLVIAAGHFSRDLQAMLSIASKLSTAASISVAGNLSDSDVDLVKSSLPNSLLSVERSPDRERWGELLSSAACVLALYRPETLASGSAASLVVELAASGVSTVASAPVASHLSHLPANVRLADIGDTVSTLDAVQHALFDGQQATGDHRMIARAHSFDGYYRSIASHVGIVCDP